ADTFHSFRTTIYNISAKQSILFSKFTVLYYALWLMAQNGAAENMSLTVIKRYCIPVLEY
ncbi:MAG: hypothetical protein IJG67_03285, partial [Oscillospiraceae bacterium]|nr:hypothetical protein [Oscillospiraceae bacterium]